MNSFDSIYWMQPLDQMKRISRQEISEKLDEILDIVDKENVGFVITDDGKDDLVLCPACWFIEEADPDFGLIVNSAVRYSIGRQTYMPDTVIRYVRRHLGSFDERTIRCIIEDIEREKDNQELYKREDWMLLRLELLSHLEAMQKGSSK